MIDAKFLFPRALAAEESEWRGNSMPLLEFLRKSNAKGSIIRWLKQKINREPEEERPNLEVFAQHYVCQGEKAIAAAMVSRLRDRYYGQWLARPV